LGSVTAQMAMQKKLNEALIESQLRNPAFSLRAFSRKLSISPSALSEILNGKRRVSKKLAERLVRNLCLSPKEGQGLLDLFGDKHPEKDAEAKYQGPYIELSTDQFHVISEWYHFGILSLAETVDFQSDPRWIADRLNIRVQDAQTALERLERLGLVERGPRGKLTPTGTGYSTPDEVRDLGLRKAHGQNLEMARRSLEEDPIEVRDFTATTMAIDVSKLPLAKKMIREFQDKLCAYLESGAKKEVYKLCIQVFPLTSRKEATDDK
jgi:uncharacterized protein (TIGR02147 family)